VFLFPQPWGLGSGLRLCLVDARGRACLGGLFLVALNFIKLLSK